MLSQKLLPFLILGLSYLLWRVGYQVWRSYQHVDETVLREFWSNRLEYDEPATFRRVRDHLVRCENCRHQLDRISQTERPEFKRLTRTFERN